MIEVILNGITFGLLLSILIGPVFMYLIEVSIRKGVREALYVDFGVFLSDVASILISYIFLNQLLFLKEEKGITGLIGGGIFIIFGLAYVLKKPKPMKDPAEVKVKRISGKKAAINILKGFFLNMMNPSVILYWLSVTILAVTQFDYEGANIFVFFSALLITFFSIDVLKIIGASYLKRFLKNSIIERINIFTGVAFLVGGVIMVVSGINHL